MEQRVPKMPAVNQGIKELMTGQVALKSQQDNKAIRTSKNHQKALQKINDSYIRIQEML